MRRPTRSGLIAARARRAYRRTIGGFLLGLLICCSVTGCESGMGGAGEGPGHRSQQLLLSPEQELALGRKAYAEVLSHPDEFGPRLSAGDPGVERVRGIMDPIARASEIQPLQQEMNLRIKGYKFEWEVNVLRKEQINAFCLPAGKMVVFTGILPVAQNDSQLATVMSHEMAHALAHHASERLAREQGYQRALQVFTPTSGDDRRSVLGVLAAGAGGLRAKAYDRQQESEADHIGVFLMTFAGYDPDEAVRFWQRMAELGSQRAQIPEILSDHPSDARRIRYIEVWASYAKAAKKTYDEGRIAR